MCEAVLSWLEAELKAFPDRTPQDEFYGYFLRRAGEAIGTDRSSVVSALTIWIQSRSEPRTMLALKISPAYHLSELRPEIEQLLNDIMAGRAFLPYHSRYVLEALDNL